MMVSFFWTGSDVITVWNGDLNAGKMLPLCQRWLHLLTLMEYSHDGLNQKPVKHCSLKPISYVLIAKDFACTKHVLSCD